MRVRVILLAVVMAMAGNSALAALMWDETTLSITPEAGAAQCVASFGFRNTGPERVSIHGLVADCECASATSDRRAYEPGERGIVQVTVQLGAQTGELTKSISVITDDPSAASQRLVVHVTIPPFAALQPQLLIWNDQERGSAKEVQLQLVKSSGARLGKIDADWTPLRIDTVETNPGELYRILLTPPRESSPRNVNVTVEILVAGRTVKLPLTAVLR